MGSSQSKDKSGKTSADDTAKAPEASQEPQTANDAPVSTSTADNVLSASEGQVTVGGVVVIEHEQENGEANEEHGGA